jgi:hypothetical protein
MQASHHKVETKAPKIKREREREREREKETITRTAQSDKDPSETYSKWKKKVMVYFQC